MSGSSPSFWRSVVVVLSGTAAAQAIPLLGSLVLARLFAPAEFGAFATWLGMASLSAVLITGRYEMALPLESDGALRRFGVLSTLLVTAAGGGVLVLLAAGVVVLGLLPGVAPVLLWIGVPAAVAIAASQTWQNWAAAEGRYRALSAIRIAQAVAITVAQLLAGWLHPSAVGLVLGHLCGLLCGLAVAAWQLPLHVRGEPVGASAVSIRSFLRRHARFPSLSLPADGINTAAAQLPLLIVASRFGTDFAGLLAMALRMVGAPIGLLGAAVLDVFRRKSAASFRAHGHCRDDYVATFRVLSIGAAGTAVVLGFAAEPLFALVFGEPWRMSGTVAAWLMPMFALRFVASPLSYTFYVAGKQHVDLVWQIGLLAVTFASLWLPADRAAALQVYGSAYAAMYCLYLALSYRFSKGAQT